MLAGTLIVRTHDGADGLHGIDEEFELPTGDRVRLERVDANMAGQVLDAKGVSRELSLGTHDVLVAGTFEDGALRAERVERPQDESSVRKVMQPALDVFGERETLVLLIGFPGEPNTYDPLAMHEGVFGEEGSTDALYREASRNKMWLGGIDDPEGDVWGPYEAPTDGCSTLTYSEVSDLALQAAEADGVDVDAYRHRIYSFPPVNSCPGGGIGGGNQVWVFGITPQYIWDWVGHEAAHGFGFGHASSYDDCTVGGDPVTIGGACIHNEYGDPTDIQGRRNFQFSSWHMERAGWLEPENVAVVETSQRVVLVPIEDESDQVQSLRVPRQEDELEGEFFHFEYRQPIGFDAGLESGLTSGVLVRTVVDPDARGNPHLLDMTPETSDNIDASLRVGRSFEAGNMLVTVVEATSEHAVIDVTLDGVPPEVGTGGTDGIGTGGADATGGIGGNVATGGAPSAGGAPSVGTGGASTGGAVGAGTRGFSTGGAPQQPGDAGGASSSSRAAEDESGCGCRTVSRPGGSPYGMMSGLLGALWWARRRRRVR